MRIIAKSTLREFWEHHPDAKVSLETWYKRASKETWNTPGEATAMYSQASAIGNNRIVFRIKENYRLVVEVNYRNGMVFVRFIGTHAQYDRIDAEEV